MKWFQNLNDIQTNQVEIQLLQRFSFVFSSSLWHSTTINWCSQKYNGNSIFSGKATKNPRQSF